MKVLIADDDAGNRLLLESNLARWGHEIVSCEDGQAAWEIYERPNPPKLAILDWMMPKLDGVDLCRKIRELPHGKLIYLIILTAKDKKENIIEGLDAGANDYMVKPFDSGELQARFNVGMRVVDLQERLLEAERNRVLTQAAGAAAHEINQPLTVLVGTSELLLYQVPEDSEHRENITQLHDASKRISEIVKKMGTLRKYATKPYIDGIEIIDFDAASEVDPPQ